MSYLMRGPFLTVIAVAFLLPMALARIDDAWNQAIRLNAGFEARELDSLAAVMTAEKARTACCRR